MCIKALLVTLPVLFAAICSAMATEENAAGAPERGPPSGPMTMQEAGIHWDGTGELLLLPPDEKTTPLGFRGNFAIGATFDNADAPKPEVDLSNSAFRRCPAGIYPIQLIRGGLIFSSPMSDQWRQPLHIMGSRDPDANGSFMETIETDRCRYTLPRRLTVRVKTRDHDEWSPLPRYVPPPPAPPTSETKVIKSGETITIKFPPTPSELSLWTANSRLGPYVPPDIASKCPVTSGSMWFEPQGVYVSMPWRTDDLIIPGIRRDTVARSTTLIFQDPECRVELSVYRYIRSDDGWHASPLSVSPVGDGGG